MGLRGPRPGDLRGLRRRSLPRSRAPYTPRYARRRKRARRRVRRWDRRASRKPREARGGRDGLPAGGHWHPVRQDPGSPAPPPGGGPEGVRASLREAPPPLQGGRGFRGRRRRKVGPSGGGGDRAVDLGRVEVPVAPPYPVVVGVGLDLAGIVSGELEPGVAAILTDSNVGPLHAPTVGRALEDAGWHVAEVLEVPAGELSKGLAVYAEVAGALARAGFTRDGTLFALGGGVVGDLGGFVAATFMRGIGFVALPTSLLAMVDSSVGGKVGVDLPEGKNLLGSFLRPRLVAADLDWLETLPGRELSWGLAEVVKMGLLSGGRYFEDLDGVGAARSRDLDALRALVLDSVRFKAQVVAEDELRSEERRVG